MILFFIFVENLDLCLAYHLQGIYEYIAFWRAEKFRCHICMQIIKQILVFALHDFHL